MKRKLLLLSALAFAAVLSSGAALAEPSRQEVAAAVKSGNYPQAETLIKEVIAAHPQSAKAHYEYAEILSYEARFADASAEARKAREIDPAIKFDDPQKFRQFEQELQRAQATPVQAAPTQVAPAATRVIQQQAPYSAPASSGIPGWVWFMGIAVVLFFIFRAVSRRAMGMTQQGMSGGGFANQGGGYGMQPGYGQPGYGQPGFGQAPGGGLLRTGLAAAGGVAAGMLVEKMLDDRRDDRDDRSGLMGGGGGTFESDSSRAASELENRPFDQGNGNDWGDGGGGGSDNFTPSGDDGGW